MTAEKTITLPFPLIESRISLVVGIVLLVMGKKMGCKTIPLLVGQILVKEVFE